MRAVVATSFTPALGSGTGLRTFGVLAALSAHGPVHVVYVPFGGDAPAAEVLALPGLTVEAVRPSRGARRVLAVLAARVREGMPLELARAVSGELQAAAVAAAGAHDRVIADGPTAAGALLGLARRRPCTYLAHNLETSFRGTPGLERFERRLLETYAQTWMCTRADADGARALAPGARHVAVVPNVVRVPDAPAAPSAEPRVLMLADFRYAPNEEAVRWLVGDVMPRLWVRRPDARLDLAGRGLPEGLAGDPRVRALGYVERLPETYAAARVVAVPLLRGGGSPLKFVEALSYGRPVVATEHAAALIEDGRPGEHFLAAADADAFAAALAGVLEDGGEALGGAGRALVRERLSIEALVPAVAP